jgi:hypothetical protein
MTASDLMAPALDGHRALERAMGVVPGARPA